MYDFTYQKPASLADAAKAIAAAEDGKLMAGGMTLIPTLKQRLAKPSDVVDLGGIKELAGIKAEGSGVTIGAMTKHYEVSVSPDVKKTIPALADLAGHIGDPAVRNRGTIGGSVANSDPAADYPAAVVALNATINTNTGKHAADGFFKGLFETASRYAMVGVFVAKTKDGVRVAVTGAGSAVFRVKAMEDALAKNFTSAAIKDIKIPSKDLNSDIHGSAEYRAHLVGVMARRAVDAANK
jgi:carbon-monoxide dehydrogenase medium subunit